MGLGEAWAMDKECFGEASVHGESWGMFEILWVGSGMDGEIWGRFGECTWDAFERHVEAWVFVP